MSLSEKITHRTAQVAVIGLGYVGLPLALASVKAGFPTVGLEVSERKVQAIQEGRSYIEDIKDSDLAPYVQSGLLRATTDYDALRTCDVIFICVPTPYTIQRVPDLTDVLNATRGIASRLQPGQLVVLQSTTYPGTTTEDVLPILEAGSGLKAGVDFYLAFSPERIDPGNQQWSAYNTPKVVGGLTRECTTLAAAFLRQMGAPVHEVSSPATAELTKLLENTFRAVNIALVNEIALLCERMGIDVWEVIAAAKTKPFGFMPFSPGPGVGGHCLSAGEYIFVRNGNGQGVQAVQIGDYVARLSEKQPATELAGVTCWQPEQLEILSFDPYRQKPCLRPVTLISRRPYTGAMVEVLTVDGRRLTVTDGHPMLVWETERAFVRRADALQPGDELIIPLGLAETAPLPELDVIAALSPEAQRHVRVTPQTGSWADLAPTLTPALRALGIAPRDIYRSNAMPLLTYLALEAAGVALYPRAAVWLGTGRGPSYARCPAIIPWTESLARLIGYYLSEGCMSGEGYRLRVRFTFNRDEAETLADLKAILSELGLQYSVYDDKQWHSQTVKVGSWPFALLLRDGLRCGVNSRTMRIPGVLLTAPEPLRLALLAGLLRGDGDVYHTQAVHRYRKDGQTYQHRSNVCTVGYFSSSPELFQQVAILLQSLHFTPTFKRTRPQLRLYGEEQLTRLTPLFLDVKRQRLEAYRAGRSKPMPTTQSQPHGDFATVKVRSVTPAPAADTVYSVEVDGTHTFTTSYGVLVHNCIPIDPYYLLWKAREYDFYTRFIELAAETNEAMPYHVVELTVRGLGKLGKALEGAQVLVLGVAFKPDIGDPRNSPAERVIELLLQRGAQVQYHDPYVLQFCVGGNVFQREPLQLSSVALTPEMLAAADAVVIVTGHRGVDYGLVLNAAPLVIDSCNATRGLSGSAQLVRLGAPL